MTADPKSGKSRKKPGASEKENDGTVKPKRDSSGKTSDAENPNARPVSEEFHDLKWEVASSALRAAAKVGGASIKMGKALLHNPEQLNIIREAGRSLHDLRELAGLTRKEVEDALKLKDTSLVKAVENGTATLSFELILRLAALYSRHDPLPFIIKYTRTYNPGIWKLLDDWGVGRLPLYLERERQFVNIYRNHDRARQLSDKEFENLLKFTRAAFEMALDFISKEESYRF